MKSNQFEILSAPKEYLYHDGADDNIIEYKDENGIAHRIVFNIHWKYDDADDYYPIISKSNRHYTKDDDIMRIVVRDEEFYNMDDCFDYLWEIIFAGVIEKYLAEKAKQEQSN